MIRKKAAYIEYANGDRKYARIESQMVLVLAGPNGSRKE